MADIAFDFMKDWQQKDYPCHGWAVNSQGIKLLWLPLIHLIQETEKVRGRNTISDRLTLVQIKEIRCFHNAVEKLFVALRELHRTTTFLVSCAGFDNPKNDTEGIVLTIPLYVDLVYMYLRRLADHFTRAIRFSVFKHFDSAPREFKKLRKMDVKTLNSLQPLVDVNHFIKAVRDNDSWFDIFKCGRTDKGITRFPRTSPNNYIRPIFKIRRRTLEDRSLSS